VNRFQEHKKPFLGAVPIKKPDWAKAETKRKRYFVLLFGGRARTPPSWLGGASAQTQLVIKVGAGIAAVAEQRVRGWCGIDSFFWRCKLQTWGLCSVGLGGGRQCEAQV
jgi:hypothetical protein